MLLIRNRKGGSITSDISVGKHIFLDIEVIFYFSVYNEKGNLEFCDTLYLGLSGLDRSIYDKVSSCLGFDFTK